MDQFWFGTTQVKSTMRTAFAPPLKAATAHQATEGGIHYSGRSELICLRSEGRITGAKYVEKILREELAFFDAHIEAHSINPPVIVKDNDPCH